MIGLLLSAAAMASLPGLMLLHAGPVQHQDHGAKQPPRAAEPKSSMPAGGPPSRSMDSYSRNSASDALADEPSHVRRIQAVATRVARSISVSLLGSRTRIMRPGDEGSVRLLVTAPAVLVPAGFGDVVRVRTCLDLRHAALVGDRCSVLTLDPRKETRFRTAYHFRAETSGVLRATATVHAAVDGRPKVLIAKSKPPFEFGSVEAGPMRNAEAWWKRVTDALEPLVVIAGGVLAAALAVRQLRKPRRQRRSAT